MTADELRDHLLRHIGILGAGSAASAEDAVLAETILANAHGELEQLSIALWPIEDVPSYAVEAFMKYTAPMLAGYHGKADEFPLTDRLLAIRMLRELTADSRTSVGRAEFF